ncbi:hypothetical protein RRG08_054421 [Elysia crispata]|uniref:Uncharacterized protein n=1 Tax=Elysia crispata TaxID=231223 RepID=A0AAE1AVS4_9GAST|nr:hypothetical protein RRG08_054421 [Elysia crispata]
MRLELQTYKQWGEEGHIARVSLSSGSLLNRPPSAGSNSNVLCEDTGFKQRSQPSPAQLKPKSQVHPLSSDRCYNCQTIRIHTNIAMEGKLLTPTFFFNFRFRKIPHNE